ncbi:MAG: hypothetical protein WCP97_08735 [bacterium]
MSKKSVSFLVGTLFSLFLLTSCESGLKPTDIGLNQEIKLKDATVQVLSIESAKTLTSSAGTILTVPSGKKYIVATLLITSDSDAIKMASDVAFGLYKDDVTSGIASVNRELTGTTFSKDYLDSGAKSYIDTITKGTPTKIQEIYEVDVNAAGLKYRVGEKYSWKNLHSVAVDKVITERKALEILPEMKAFMGMLNGKDTSSGAALDKYLASGASDGNMGLYNNDKPEVVGENKVGDQTCYTMKAKSGLTERKYDICWKDGKIQKVTDKGI